LATGYRVNLQSRDKALLFKKRSRTDTEMVTTTPDEQLQDRAGKPFVGPAGRVLDEALDEVGIDRSRVHVTASILRAPDPESREAEGRAFVEDLRTVQHLLDK
jgi:uracil-DNA glycosylase family 4